MRNMLKLTSGLAALAIAASIGIGTAQAVPSVGAPAPQFEATLTSGQKVKLSDFAGKLVVLEWTNKDCPFVRKHYSSGNMQAVQEAVAKQGGAWLSIISSAPGKEGFVDAAGADANIKAQNAKVSGVILDPKGDLGHLYGASATPGMFVIDASQTLRYLGAIDDRPSANPSSIEGASNYVLAAVDAVAAGHDVSVKETAPYGCSVKY